MDIPMKLICCAHCGQPFAMSQDKAERLRKCHNTFYCPDGHAQKFIGKTEEERLRERVREFEDAEKKRETDSLKRRAARKKSTKNIKGKNPAKSGLHG